MRLNLVKGASDFYNALGINPNRVTWLTLTHPAFPAIPMPNIDTVPQSEIKNALVNVPLHDHDAIQTLWRKAFDAMASITIGEQLPEDSDYLIQQYTSWTIDTSDGIKRRFDIGWHTQTKQGVLRVYRNGVSSVHNDSDSATPYQHGWLVFTIDHTPYRWLANELEAGHKFDHRTELV